MSIFIKGMEMPSTCPFCPLQDPEYGDCRAGATGDFEYGRRPDCPLTEVKAPHGRLIEEE